MAYDSDYEIRLATLEAMGGDVTKHYDSVYAIDLEILRLTEQGGGGGASIEEVDVLPDAAENKDKFFRLASDKKVYVAELVQEGSSGNTGLGFAAIAANAYVFKRYPDGDGTNVEEGYTNLQKAWVLINDSVDMKINNITDWDDIDTSFLCFTETETPSIGETAIDNTFGEPEEIEDYSPNVGYVAPTPATWDLEKVATEQYVDDAIAEIPQLEAGQNIDITDNKIAAKGYFYDDEPKTELKSIDDMLAAAGMPAGMSLGLKVSGVAGATTYTYTDAIGGGFAQLVLMGMLPGVGATYQTANGKKGVIASIDASTITFEETLDADNALTEEPVNYVVSTSQLFSFAEGIYDYVDGDISTFGLKISGAAGATTYTYTDNQNILSDIPLGSILKLQDDRSAKLVSIDNTNNTALFETTFDADNALNNELIVTCSNKNYASGNYSHVEGGYEQLGVILSNIASGKASHAEGGGTTASGLVSHAEGFGTTASDMGSHAEGFGTTASGNGSHAEGQGTTAQNQCEHAEGKYNVSHRETTSGGTELLSTCTRHSVGIGISSNLRKNAFEIMQNGDMYVLGVGGYQGINTKVQDASIKTLQEYIASLEARIAALENPNA